VRGWLTTAVDYMLALRIRVESFALKLAVSYRTLSLGDKVAIPPTAPPASGLGWFHSMSTGMLRDASSSYAQVAYVMSLMPHTFIEDGHRHPPFRRAQRLLAAAAAVDAVTAVMSKPRRLPSFSCSAQTRTTQTQSSFRS